jgi:hypothetical protein
MFLKDFNRTDILTRIFLGLPVVVVPMGSAASYL